MEIRNHSFQNFEFVAGINENLRLAVSGVDETVFAVDMKYRFFSFGDARKLACGRNAVSESAI